MIKIENADVHGFASAIRGMRNPMNSWDKSDSIDDSIGANDLTLMKSLVKSGSDHRKFMRMICVWCDITAPLYWWKEFDTYKVGTVANSCSTMHKITAKEFTLDDFSYEKTFDSAEEVLKSVINDLNYYRSRYLEIKSTQTETGVKRDDDMKAYWWQLIQLLPSSYNQRRTVLLNYEVLLNMCNARENHKLDEWREFCKYMNMNLPYFYYLTKGGNNEN